MFGVQPILQFMDTNIMFLLSMIIASFHGSIYSKARLMFSVNFNLMLSGF
uniref:Uncharacterized protein n=1 Tax=Arundo donax TaxID=35708 RepID=A0A0A8Z9I8_ARUDO